MAARGAEVRGKVVAVTGGARGIGRATARAASQAGARVAIGDLDGELAKMEAGDLGGEALGLGLDVSDRSSFEAFVDQVEESLGPLDVLVNNAGLLLSGLLAEERPEVTERMIEVNLRGVIVGSQLAAQRMLPRRSGHIVNIASVAGKAAFPGGATYCATKHAVVGLSESLHAELHGTGVAISVVMPAVVRTELTSGLDHDMGEKIGGICDPTMSPRRSSARCVRVASRSTFPAASADGCPSRGFCRSACARRRCGGSVPIAGCLTPTASSGGLIWSGWGESKGWACRGASLGSFRRVGRISRV